MHESLWMLHWLYAGVLFIFGLAMGSFLNVVAWRVPMNMSVLRPPSSCPSCGTRILARDNVPLLGWLALRGRCRSCRKGIPARYPLVELATGVLWAGVGWMLAGMDNGYWTNLFVGLLWLAFVSAMVVTFLVDWDFQIILDEISLGGLAAALVASILLPVIHGAETSASFHTQHPMLAGVLGDAPAWLRSLSVSLIGAAVGLAFSLAIYFVCSWVFRRQIEQARQDDPEIDSALGLGDVKLMAAYGALFGWVGVIFIYMAGSVLGAAAGTVMKLRSGDPEGRSGLAGLARRWENGSSVIPFGPFLVLASLVFLFWGDGVIDYLFPESLFVAPR